MIWKWKIGVLFGFSELKMGSPDAQSEDWHMVATSEETPHALCKNRPEIMRADPAIFGETFFRPAQTRPTVHRRDDLWHPGSTIRSADGDWPGVGRTDSLTQDGIPFMPPTPTTRVVGTVDGNALPDGREPHPGDGPLNLRSFGHQQDVCEENGISGPSARRGRRWSGRRLLAPSDHRRRTGKTHGLATL